MQHFSIVTQQKQEVYDITEKIVNAIANNGIRNGACTVFTPHSTAALVIMENSDPSLHQDFLDQLEEIVPNKSYRHNKFGEKNGAAHIKSALINPNITIIIENGRPLLGHWQGIMFCEFDGPRNRAVYLECFEKKGKSV